MDNFHGRESEHLKRKTKQTAIERYADHYRDITALIALLRTELGMHNQKASQQPFEWGFASEAGHVRRALNEILMFLIVSRFKSKTEAARFIEDVLEAHKREKPRP